MTARVDVHRGDHLESRHQVSVAVARPDGTLLAHSGDPHLVTFWRSAAKFFQAVPLVTSGAADALGLDDEELALACASHNGEPAHLAVAARMLSRSGSSEPDLHCGAHPSLNERLAREQAASGAVLTRLHNNCSGKHAGMLALAHHLGWPRAGYERREHPVQHACFAAVGAWTRVDVESITHATDGCGVPASAASLADMAGAWARIAAAAAGASTSQVPPDSSRAVARLVRAVQAHPFLVAGSERLDTELIAATAGRIVSKVGAEGVYGAALLDQQLGVAIKVEDGAFRALAPALLAVLEELAPGAVPDLEPWRTPVLLNSNNEPVGTITARVKLTRDASNR